MNLDLVLEHLRVGDERLADGLHGNFLARAGRISTGSDFDYSEFRDVVFEDVVFDNNVCYLIL